MAPKAAAMSGVSALGGLASTAAATGAVHGMNALPALAASAGGAYTSAGQRIGAALESNRYAQVADIALKFLEGAMVPVSPAAGSVAGKWGTVFSEIHKQIKSVNYTDDNR